MYEGEAQNTFRVSEGLVKRIVEDPSRLSKLKSLLLQCIPNFASPIYIGVAKVLRVRLLRHKSLIEAFANSAALEPLDAQLDQDDSDEAVRDSSFARQVSAIRKFNSANLVVSTLPIEVDEDLRYDLENVLNRINFPLCGRN